MKNRERGHGTKRQVYVVLWGALWIFLLVAYGPAEGPSPAGAREPDAPITSPTKKAPPVVRSLTEKRSDQTFEQLLEQMMPLTPKQIRRLRQHVIETSQATYGDSPPAVRSRSVQYHPEPDQQPETVRMSPGFVATVSAVDAAGAPWPITSFTVGQPDWFKVIQPELKQRNRLTVSTQKHGVVSNLALTLQNLNTPVVVMLRSDPTQTDGLTTIRISRRGPNAPEPVMESRRRDSVVSRTMLDFLDGVYPQDATPGQLRPGVPGSVWKYRGSLFLRTSLRLLSPPWDSVVKGGETTRVYRLPQVDVVLLSDDGAIRTVEVLFNE